jgi:glycosyltransferase involved in cell wall biosynthesis
MEVKPHQRFSQFSKLPLPLSNRVGWPWTEESLLTPESIADSFPWPRITIVTPSYNQGNFIEETIRSVLLQGYPNLEYIIMDGGSTDNTVEIIKKYEPWLTYWVSEKDRGQSHAINKGFLRATGEIYGWINSDDGYLPGALSLVAQSISNRKKTIVIGASKRLYELGAREEIDRRRPTHDEMLYEGRTFPQPGVFWTMDLWDAANCLREELFYAMDYDVWLRMLPKAESVIFSDAVFSYEHWHAEQKMQFKNEIEEEIYFSQKAYVVLQAARLMGIHPLYWMARSYFRRISNSLKTGAYTSLRGSRLQKAAFRALFYQEYISWMSPIQKGMSSNNVKAGR